MFRRKRRVIATVASGLVILLAAAALRLSPLWPGPALPEGAARLQVVTAAPHLVPTFGCPAALLGPVRITTSNNVLLVLSIATGEPISVVWPSGWGAWRVDGGAELVTRDGAVIAREGEVIEGQFGGGVSDDDAFHVCIIGG